MLSLINRDAIFFIIQLLVFDPILIWIRTIKYVAYPDWSKSYNIWIKKIGSDYESKISRSESNYIRIYPTNNVKGIILIYMHAIQNSIDIHINIQANILAIMIQYINKLMILKDDKIKFVNICFIYIRSLFLLQY